jgi:hypothetical protein
MKKQQGQFIRKSSKNSKKKGSKQPPAIPGNTRVNCVYRFLCPTAGEYTVNQGDLLSIAGGVCTATNSSTALIAMSCKVNSVEIWSPGQSGPTTIALEWTSAIGLSRGRQVMDTTVSTAAPAHIWSKPRHSDAAGLEFATGSGLIMILDLPVGALMDINCTHTLIDDATSISKSITAGTLGHLYYFGLAGGVIVPVERQTTI